MTSHEARGAETGESRRQDVKPLEREQRFAFGLSPQGACLSLQRNRLWGVITSRV